MSKIRSGKVVSGARIERRQGGRDDAKTSKLVYPEGVFGATLRGIRIAPQKARLVADQIRGLSVDEARKVLRYSQKRAGYYFDRILLSAIGNADSKSDGNVSAEDLYVSSCYVNEGTRMKRFLAGPHGRARPILRRLCHITVVVSTISNQETSAE